MSTKVQNFGKTNVMFFDCLPIALISDEAKVLEQVIRDTEQISLEDEVVGEGEGEEEGREGGGEGDRGSSLVIEPGSAAALLEEFVGRYKSCDCHVTF